MLPRFAQGILPRVLLLAACLAAGAGPAQGAALERVDTGISAATLGIIINVRDPLSVEIGNYYARRRAVPPGNIVRISVNPERTTLGAKEFATLKAGIDAGTPAHVQAYALTWVRPYRVECMSITTAIAAGFDARFCGEGCATTRLSPYYNSGSRAPHTDFQLRPAMSLAAEGFASARALIERGIAADGTDPDGTAYLVETEDAARNVRAASYRDVRMLVGKEYKVQTRPMNEMRGRTDVMFYFVGAMEVPLLATNRFLPGAIGDHLTSYGGELDGRRQMSALRWLEAGATGSYGTVSEPCNITAKFPNPGLMMRRYLGGETLIEAYWKSVAMPGQGIFIGEPLAALYRSRRSG